MMDTKAELDAMFTSELRQTQWAEAWSQLEDARRAAAVPDEAQASPEVRGDGEPLTGHDEIDFPPDVAHPGH